jgi:hypothetical protein
MNQEREKVGKISYDLWNKKPEAADAIEQMREQLTDYDKNIAECIERGKKDHPQDFYIVVITKRERLMPNVFRNYFTNRLSCPTPDYDQTVYKYTKLDQSVEFIWVVPSKQTCLYMMSNPLEIREKELLHFVIDFANGTLGKKALVLNNEI